MKKIDKAFNILKAYGVRIEDINSFLAKNEKEFKELKNANTDLDICIFIKKFIEK